MHKPHIPRSESLQDLLVDQDFQRHLRCLYRDHRHDQQCIQHDHEQQRDPCAPCAGYLGSSAHSGHKDDKDSEHACQDTGYDRNDQVPDPRIFDLFVFQFDRPGEFALEIIPRVRDERQPRVFFSHPFSDRIQSDRMEDVAYQCQDQHQRKDDQIN